MPDDQPPLPPAGAPGAPSVLPPPAVPAPPAGPPPALPPWAQPGPPPPPWGGPPSAPGPRPRRGWHPRPARATIAVVVLAVLVVGAAVGGWLSTSGSPATSNTGTPNGGPPATGGRAQAERLVSGSLAAAQAAGSFHYVSSSVSAAVSQVTVGDAGASSGRQVITVAGDTFTVLVVGSTAYFQGDAAAMVENLSVPPALAQARAGQWISLAAGDGPYESVKAAVTTSEALSDNVTFTPRTVLARSTIAGRRVIGVRGAMLGVAGQRGSGTATLYVAAGGRHLPVRYVENGTLTGSDGSTAKIRFRIDFSGWGEAVQVNVPSGAVTFSSLGVSGTPGQGSPPTTLIT